MNSKRKQCRKGHALAKANSYLRKDGFRECKQCAKDRVKRSRARKAQTA